MTPSNDPPQGEATTVEESAGVTAIPDDHEPSSPTPEPAPPVEASNPGVVPLSQYIADAPGRAVPAAAMVARDPALADAQQTEADWAALFAAEAQQPTLPHTPDQDDES